MRLAVWNTSLPRMVILSIVLSGYVQAIVPDTKTAEEISLLLSQVGSTEEACPLLHKKWHDRRVSSLPPNSPPVIESYNAATIRDHPTLIVFWCKDARPVASIPENDGAGHLEVWYDGPWFLDCSPQDQYSVAIFDKRIRIPAGAAKDYAYERRTIGQCVLRSSEQTIVVPPGYTRCFNVIEADSLHHSSQAWFSRSGKRGSFSNLAGALSWAALDRYPGKRPRETASTVVSEADAQYLELSSMTPGKVYRACGTNPTGQPNVLFHVGLSRTSSH